VPSFSQFCKCINFEKRNEFGFVSIIPLALINGIPLLSQYMKTRLFGSIMFGLLCATVMADGLPDSVVMAKMGFSPKEIRQAVNDRKAVALALSREIQNPARNCLDIQSADRSIIIARDSAVEEGNSRISLLQAMTPSEREDYFRELGLLNRPSLILLAR
jgi:hypothetical protein